MRRVALALSLVFIVPFLAAVYGCANQARAGEELTTWRAGDPVAFTTYCGSAEGIEQFIRLLQDGTKVTTGDCFYRDYYKAAILQEWISGPYLIRGSAGSIWRAMNAGGETIYLAIVNYAGPNKIEGAL